MTPMPSVGRRHEPRIAEPAPTADRASSHQPVGQTVIEVRVEAPGGDAYEYSADEGSGGIRLRRLVHADHGLPMDWAIVPGTLTASGEPLGVMLLTTIPCAPGALVSARPVGLVVVAGEDLIVAAVVADGRLAGVTDPADLDARHRDAIESLVAPQLPAGDELKWQGRKRAQQVIAAARHAARLARAGEHAQRHRAPAWQTGRRGVPDPARTTGDGVHTSAEWSVAKLPYRFQEYVERLLVPKERILTFVARPPAEQRTRWLAKRTSRNEGLLVVTDQQVLWIEDVLPPETTVTGYGYIARSCPLERLAGIAIATEGATARLTLRSKPPGGVDGGLNILFPGASTGILRKAEELLVRFVPGREQARIMRLTRPPEDEAPLAALVEQHDRVTLGAVAAWEHRLPTILDAGERTLARAVVQAWASADDIARLLLVTERRVMLVPGNTELGLIETWPVASVHGVVLCYSVFQSWLDIQADGGREERTRRMDFPLVSAGQFVRAFVAIRQAMVGPYGFEGAKSGKETEPC